MNRRAYTKVPAPTPEIDFVWLQEQPKPTFRTGDRVYFNQLAPIERLRELDLSPTGSLIVLRVEDDSDTLVAWSESPGGDSVYFPTGLTVTVFSQASGKTLAVSASYLRF